MPKRPIVAVYLSSKSNTKLQSEAMAEQIGSELSKNYDIVFGGRTVGSMGALASGVIKAGGSIKGVVPDRLRAKKPEPFPCIYIEEITTKDTHPLQKRKLSMFSVADAFVICPGGLGTLDELAEVLALQQIGYLHQQPVVLLNTNGYWNHLIEHINQGFKEGFIPRDPFASYLKVLEHPTECVDYLDQYFSLQKMDSI